MDGQLLYLWCLDTQSLSEARIYLVFSTHSPDIKVFKAVESIPLPTLYSCKHNVYINWCNMTREIPSHSSSPPLFLSQQMNKFLEILDLARWVVCTCGIVLWRFVLLIHSRQNKPAFGKILNNSSACKSTGEAAPKINLRSHQLSVDGKSQVRI